MRAAQRLAKISAQGLPAPVGALCLRWHLAFSWGMSNGQRGHSLCKSCARAPNEEVRCLDVMQGGNWRLCCTRHQTFRWAADVPFKNVPRVHLLEVLWACMSRLWLPSAAQDDTASACTGVCLTSIQAVRTWQVEIKLRLADRAAHARVAEALRPAFRETHQQENFFFDGARRELSSQRCVMRCRFYNTNKRALLTVKARCLRNPTPRPLQCRAGDEHMQPLHALAVEPADAWQRRPMNRRYCKCYPPKWPSCRTQSTTVLCGVQGQQVLTDGIGRGTEEEEDLDPKAARQFLTEPSRLLQLESPLVQKVRRRAARAFFLRPCIYDAAKEASA